MNFLILFRLKLSIFLRKMLLSFLLNFMYPTNTIMVALSQNLDKYIVLYQKKLFSIYVHNSNNDNSELIAWFIFYTMIK